MGRKENNDNCRCAGIRHALATAISHLVSHTHTLFSQSRENMQRPGQRDVCQHHVQGGERWKLHAKQAQSLSSQSTASKKMRKRGSGLRHLALRLIHPCSLFPSLSLYLPSHSSIKTTPRFAYGIIKINLQPYLSPSPLFH